MLKHIIQKLIKHELKLSHLSKALPLPQNHGPTPDPKTVIPAASKLLQHVHITSHQQVFLVDDFLLTNTTDSAMKIACPCACWFHPNCFWVTVSVSFIRDWSVWLDLDKLKPKYTPYHSLKCVFSVSRNYHFSMPNFRQLEPCHCDPCCIDGLHTWVVLLHRGHEVDNLGMLQ